MEDAQSRSRSPYEKRARADEPQVFSMSDEAAMTPAKLIEQAANAFQAKAEASFERQAASLMEKFEGIVDNKIKESEGKIQLQLNNIVAKFEQQRGLSRTEVETLVSDLLRENGGRKGGDWGAACSDGGMSWASTTAGRGDRKFIPDRICVRGFCTWEQRQYLGLSADDVDAFLTGLRTALAQEDAGRMDWDITRRMLNKYNSCFKVEIKVTGGSEACWRVKSALERLITADNPCMTWNGKSLRVGVQQSPERAELVQQGARMIKYFENLPELSGQCQISWSSRTATVSRRQTEAELREAISAGTLPEAEFHRKRGIFWTQIATYQRDKGWSICESLVKKVVPTFDAQVCLGSLQLQ